MSTIALVSVTGADWSLAAPVAQTAVPEAELANSPNKFVGYVRTGFDSPDPAVRGTGFVVGGRVVLSAAHVFYNPDTPGWNRATWYWQLAPKPSTFDAYSRMIAPRTYRVLAGYAAAVQREVDTATQLDAFNQDTVALLFYQRVDDNGITPLALDSVSGSGTFSLVGYPAEIGGTTTAWGQMFSHGAGVTATFARENPATDYLGNPMVLFETPDLLSGGGQSGGPLFRRIDNEWKAVGVTVARKRDYSAIVVRGLDAAAQALIDASNADTQSGIVGQIDHGWADTGVHAAPVLRADGSLVVASLGGIATILHAFDRTGTELWRRDEDYFPTQIAETPDGRIVCFDGSRVAAYQGATGKPLWSTSVYPAYSMAVGTRGEVYVAGRNVTVISPIGQTERVIDNVSIAGGQNVPSAIGLNNELYVLDSGSLIAISAAGQKLWQTTLTSDDGQTLSTSGTSSLAIGPTGRIFVRSATDFRAYDPNGALLWHIADPSATVYDRTIHILPDGRLLTLRPGVAVLMNADGQELRRISVDAGSLHVAMDAQETLYVSDSASVRAISDTAARNWTNNRTGGGLYLGSGNQLCVRDTVHTRFNVILTEAGAAPGLWQSGGGPDQGRRVAYAAPLAPRIVTAPASTTVAQGYRLELSVFADGSFPLSYEWRHDGKIVPDAFGAQLVIPFAAAADAGNYTVTVRNGAGTVTSAPVSVTVNVAKFGDPVWSTALHTVGTPAVGGDGTAYVLFFSKDAGSIGNSTISLAAFDKGGNELWRTEIGTVGSTWYLQRGPIVGDDGTVFVSSDAAVSAVSSAGAIRWKKSFVDLGASEAPYIALGTNNQLYALVENTTTLTLSCYRPDGTRDWNVDLKPFGGQAGQLLVRRDGCVIAPPMVLVSPSGAVTLLDKQYFAGLIGPTDEIAGSNGNGMKILDRAGTLLSQTTTQIGKPVLLTSDGRLVDYTGNALRFCGSTVTPLARWSSSRTVLADLGQERLLTIETSGLLEVWDHAATVAQSTTLPTNSGTNFVLSNDGVLIGGSTLHAWRVGTNPANGPWPLPAADVRQTWRAPAAFQWQVSAPQSVAVVSQGALYAGYSATFRADTDGVGPFSFQWQRDGVDLPGETQQTLSINSPTTQSSGHYRVIVSNASGTIYSPEFVAQFAAPSAAPPGFYAGVMRDSVSAQITGGYAALVHADRTIEFLTAGTSNGAGRAYSVRLAADGSFPAGFYNGADILRFTNGRIDFGSSVTVESLDVTATRATNGLPVGFYRGGAADGKGGRAYAAVLPDGRVWWAYNVLGNFGSGAQLSLPAGTLSGSGSVPSSGAAMTYTMTATPDGVLRLSRPPGASDYEFLPALGMVWDGRGKTEHLVNLSTRAWISPAWPPLIAGFVMKGQRQLLIRGVGPTLSKLGLPTSSVLAHPQLHVLNSAGVTVAEAGRWAVVSNQTELRDAAGRLGAFPLIEGSDDAALLRGFTEALYSTLLDGADGGTGNALIEVYDADRSASGSLLNLSSRGYAGGGDNVLIGGFVVTGTAPKTLLIRGIGPGLAPLIGQATFSLVANPRLRVFDSTGKALASNQIWWTGDQGHIAAVTAQVGAFTPDTFDSAVLITLEPGAYSAVVDANGGAPGVALLELYDVP